jgi:hypothetical protein
MLFFGNELLASFLIVYHIRDYGISGRGGIGGGKKPVGPFK